MTTRENQSFWVPGGATVLLPPAMRLARADRERLWKGLERFVNCGDSDSDYKALGLAFPDFWPVRIWHYPNQETKHTPFFGSILAASKDESDEADIKQNDWQSQTEDLNWHSASRNLFLFYRDTLREIWEGRPTVGRNIDDRPTLSLVCGPTQLGWLFGRANEFLLGITNYNEEANDEARNGGFSFSFLSGRPLALGTAWREIINKFPTVAVEGRVEITMVWELGDFSFVPHNGFQKAFYLLFRQNWRARVCPRCKMFFVARKPKQIFCGTVCSAGNRLASKRKWWNRVGEKRRTRKRQVMSKRNRKGGKNR